MGRIKTSSVKNIARELLEKYPERFSTDFEKNKKALAELTEFESKRTRNIVAGFITALKKQLEKQ
jgi:small subunit ribosomal protein S17e